MASEDLVPERNMLFDSNWTFRFTRKALITAAVFALIAIVSHFWQWGPKPYMNADASTTPSLPVLFGTMFCLFALLVALEDSIRVWYTRKYKSTVSFDAQYLYVDRKDEEKEEKIPLSDILSIFMADLGNRRTSRGFYTLYRITYALAGVETSFKVSVFSWNQKDMSLFQQYVKDQNPDVKIRNWNTNFNGILRLFGVKNAILLLPILFGGRLVYAQSPNASAYHALFTEGLSVDSPGVTSSTAGRIFSWSSSLDLITASSYAHRVDKSSGSEIALGPTFILDSIPMKDIRLYYFKHSDPATGKREKVLELMRGTSDPQTGKRLKTAMENYTGTPGKEKMTLALFKKSRYRTYSWSTDGCTIQVIVSSKLSRFVIYHPRPLH